MIETTASTKPSEAPHEPSVCPDDVDYYSNVIVNVILIGPPGERDGWTLIDAGLPLSASAIIGAAEQRFGAGARPDAIVLTHGHFDHVGSLPDLLKHWDVPVWAHELEAPYLSGRSQYPPPDPTVGGGMMARLSSLYPEGPIDLGESLQILPADGTIPPLPEWEWIHTPGHTAGHVSLFRPADRSLIVGDAFVTTKQESLIGALTKFHSIHGPPMYFTSDWIASRRSIEALAALDPLSAFPGHGRPVFGQQLRDDLNELLAHFDELARPRHGRYVNAPAATDETGVVSVPPEVDDPFPRLLGALALGAMIGLALAPSQDHEA
ncbi:MAG TPA: MBL fold metallo-hydrolase [Humisphaera sp.]|jgi:glyoxylase-like metal-dependent hydrolase (beta-lactamase superfamily II)|nr:MBL fold metallo-hydrolase [Humisphaera sp.]